MVRLHTRTVLPAIIVVLTFVAAASAQTADRDVDFRIKTTQILNSILEGISEGDYEKFTRDFSPTLKKAQDRENFLQLQRKIQKSLGKLRSSEFMGSYTQQGAVIALFKVRFSKDKDDILIKLVFDGQSNSKVTGLWFDSPAID